MSMASQYHMESEVAYGGLNALGLGGLLTLYSRLRWTGQGRELAVGTAWSLSAALPAMLELEAMRRESRTSQADLGCRCAWRSTSEDNPACKVQIFQQSVL